jgi:hypothetical protein
VRQRFTEGMAASAKKPPQTQGALMFTQNAGRERGLATVRVENGVRV